MSENLKLDMTVDEALAFAEEWTRGMTLHAGSQGWRVVCLLLGEEVKALREENERLKNTAKTCGAIIHNMTVANQAAWIEWQHGGGAESAMEWVENGLVGPGLIPEDDEPHNTNAQAYFDANISGPGGL